MISLLHAMADNELGRAHPFIVSHSDEQWRATFYSAVAQSSASAHAGQSDQGHSDYIGRQDAMSHGGAEA